MKNKNSSPSNGLIDFLLEKVTQGSGIDLRKFSEYETSINFMAPFKETIIYHKFSFHQHYLLALLDFH